MHAPVALIVALCRLVPVAVLASVLTVSHAEAVAADEIPRCGCNSDSMEAFLAPALALRRPTSLGAAAEGLPGPCTEDGSVIDVLVVYTESALTAAGSVVAMETLIDDIVADANDAFANSNIPVTLRLVATAEVTGVSSGNGGLDLHRLIEPDDNYFVDVPALRDQHAADIVSLITEGSNVCGIARVAVAPGPTPRPADAFNVLRRSCLGPGAYVFAHEIGHNLGLMHDWIEDECTAGATQYAKGHVDPADAFKTIMAYGDAPAIPHFANPDVLYDGVPTGVAVGQPQAADAAATIAMTAPIVANYRSLDCNGNGACDADDITMGASLDCDANGIPDECDVDCNGNGLPDACDIDGGGSLDTNTNGLPDECEPAIMYVDADATGLASGTNWTDACTDLQHALTVAALSSGGVQEIWVAEGTYTPGVAPHRAETFRLVSGVGVYGGFAGGETERDARDPALHLTVLDGDLLGDDAPGFANYDDNSISTVTGSNTDATAILDGFVIRGGNADFHFTDCWFTAYNAGGGIRIFSGSPTIRDCTFIENRGTGDGGGGYTVNGASPLFQGCRFLDNLADFSHPGNPGSGGALGLGTGTQNTRLVDCLFQDNTSGNTGGAIFDRGNSTEYLNCVFVGNTTGSTGGAVRMTKGNTTTTSFTNCLFRDNEAGVGGAFYAYGAGVQDLTYTFTNCTFTDNHATGSGGAMSPGFYDLPVLNNCVLWGNSDNGGFDQTAQITAGVPTVNDSTLQGWDGTFAGSGSDGDDPLLDVDGRPAAGSPAIDTGNVAALPADTLDLDGDADVAETLPLDLAGDARVSGPSVDRGAYEAAGVACPADVTVDGEVDVDDLVEVIVNWGDCPGCPADVTADGEVDVDDLVEVIVAWGVCL